MRLKADRRKYYRNLKDSFRAEQYLLWNGGLALNLKQVLKILPKKQTIAVYSHKEKEADLSALFQSGHIFCFPKVTSMDKASMEFRAVSDPLANKFFEAGAYGISEPIKTCPIIAPEDIDICFLPLLAFDDQGNRLGQGKGFYDRFLENFSGIKIGVGFEWQYSPQTLPVDAHDQKLNMVVTEHKIRNFRTKNSIESLAQKQQ